MSSEDQIIDHFPFFLLTKIKYRTYVYLHFPIIQ